MAEPTTMVTWAGKRHRVGRAEPRPGYLRLTAACSSAIVEFSDMGQDRPAESDCKRCFPSSDASLGAASTTLNPPPGEHTNLGDSK